jgi:mRNA-degrading endonuclease toxin of MazEF toxin-antitoxin module
LLGSEITGLPSDSVANVSQVIALDKRALGEAVGRLDKAKVGLVLSGIDVVLGR